MTHIPEGSGKAGSLSLCAGNHGCPTTDRARDLKPYEHDRVGTVHDEDAVHGWKLFDRKDIHIGKWKLTWIQEPYGPGRWQLFNLDLYTGETEKLTEVDGDIMGRLMIVWDE